MKARSPHWGKLQKKLVGEHPYCSACGCRSRRKLVAHHIVPYHHAPELELEPSNLIVLCESGRYGVHCHLFLGHFGDFKRRHNPDIKTDAATWLARLVEVR
jgi:hypothetical protein